jgi:hypothetical protein
MHGQYDRACLHATQIIYGTMEMNISSSSEGSSVVSLVVSQGRD